MKPVKRMMQDIERGVELTRSMIGKHALDPRVMEAMKTVPRHEFVPADAQAYARTSQEALAPLPDNSSRHVLHTIAEYVMHRSH